MASSQQRLTNNERRDSITSTASLWDKLPETKPAPVDIADDNDFIDEDDLTENDTEDEFDTRTSDSNLPIAVHKRFASSSNLQNLEQNVRLWEFEQYNQIKIITHQEHIERAKIELQRRLSSQELRWISNDDERIRSWHLGLSFLCFQLKRTYQIDMIRLTSIRPFTVWLRFKNNVEQQQKRRVVTKPERVKPIRYGHPPRFCVLLRYGALTELDEFRYSSEHSWPNDLPKKFSLFIDNERSGGTIEWVIEDPENRIKKQMLAKNVDRYVIVHLLPDGFAMYICQKCNMSEFSAAVQKSRKAVEKFSLPSYSRRRGPMRPSITVDNRVTQRVSYEKYKRIGIRNGGIYFPTVQFELRIDPNQLANEQARNAVQRTYHVLIQFFTSHHIKVCYGRVNSNPGPRIDLLPTLKLPSLIMKYSWQMLLNIGYRLQVQIDHRFCHDISLLSREKWNADDLFYRVCVYLWRLFTLEPFVNLSEKLNDAIEESKRKRENSTFGLINSLNCEHNTETYVPSVTLTPTLIRIKPLKLCRTNRVLRATQEFGKALEHFALVDIRDENGERLQSFHFRDLHGHFLGYLEHGFPLMDNNRDYRYLHHSQSQIRSSQFWFYHHEPGLNRSLYEAYEWMGAFDTERNVAKNASRIALCFSTTTPTIEIDLEYVRSIPDIKTKDEKLVFTDGCGTLSQQLRDDIQKSLGKRPFSVVQFRYAGAKGVVSVNPQLGPGYHLCIRHSMDKFVSEHRCFEVCKVSAPRSLYLNRQVILLLSNRRIADSVFLMLQQRNNFALIRSLLRNDDAKYLLGEKLPYWFLPYGAKIDFVHEPFFRQLVITACLSSVRDLLRRTRICVSRNKARNMFGIIDEYNVLKPDEVFVQYTQLHDREDTNGRGKRKDTRILRNCKVVVTKNPCHHPGDVRTFTAVDHAALKHLNDVIVFSQQGNCPAPHQISGSDLDGDEYAVIWHEDIVPLQTDNAEPYNYDSNNKPLELDRPVERKDIHDVVLNIAESDFLGRLSNLHLAYADRFGVDSDIKPQPDVLSTIKLAGAISEEVDSGKTGVHPLNDMKIKKQKDALGDSRPDFMENTNMKSYKSDKILGKLYRASRRTLPLWNKLLRRHRYLRHLQVRTPEDDDEEQDEEVIGEDDQANIIPLDPSLLNTNLSSVNHEMSEIASQLFYVYRQEMLEILNLYGLSHESDLWCRQATNIAGSELEDTAFTQLEQLVTRTREAFSIQLIPFCPNDISTCDGTAAFESLCRHCQQLHNSVAAALYREAYSGQNGLERAPILSLPWLFAAALLKSHKRELTPMEGLLTVRMEAAIKLLIDNSRLKLDGLRVEFRSSENHQLIANIDWSVCVFVEILHNCLKPNSFNSWPMILSKFIRETKSFECEASSVKQYNAIDDWLLVFNNHDQDDIYAATLISIQWPEDVDELMHSYFENILEICYTLSQSMEDDNNDCLQVSEEIILILQRVAIEETPFPKNYRK
ncbi:unnamed protein product [Rotaria magnacalcarata]|uniref:RNA-dependent RNA polymerase n=1 Tax=Rotaria magnacalcarata TaxID=392030 RepID=A0A816VUE8_9BILA|nr:unnamed protein product [Rotaria magnacalcarata]CAF3819956.1 unnamed protein product [Rotaria magnacalcarata]